MVQIQNELKDASNKDLVVCVDGMHAYLESAMKSLQHAFKAPEIRAALSDWHNKEEDLKKVIQKCKSEHEDANEALDVDAAKALHSKVNVLNRQLWQLVRAIIKQDRVNKEEASCRAHFLLAEQGAEVQATIAADRQR